MTADMGELHQHAMTLAAKHKRGIAIYIDGDEYVVADMTTEGRGRTVDEAIADYERKVQR